MLDGALRRVEGLAIVPLRVREHRFKLETAVECAAARDR
jgi:hypothetical protein